MTAKNWEIQSEENHLTESNANVFLADEETGLFILCQGHGNSEQSKALGEEVCESISEFISLAQRDEEATWPFPISDRLTHEENLLHIALQNAQKLVSDQCSQRGLEENVALSIALILLGNKSTTIARWGSIRIYRFADGNMNTLFREQTLANYRDLWPPHPLMNIPLCALGIHSSLDDRLIQAVREIESKKDDVFILASSGVASMNGDPILDTFNKTQLVDFTAFCLDSIASSDLESLDKTVVCIGSS